jgi:hypothetical protein
MAVFTLADFIFGAATIRQITAADHRTNQEHRKAMTSGGVVIQQVSGKAAGEVTQITSGDLAALLALNAGSFISAGSLATATTITVALKARANGGAFAAGNNHDAITGAAAFLVPTLIEATQDGDFATCQTDLHWLSADGVTKAADDATGQALGGQSFNAEFALGPVYINGSLIAGVQSFRVTPGLEIVKPPLGSGAVWPTRAMIKSIMPTLEITVNDFAAVAGSVGDWTAMTSANAYLRRRADSGVYSSSSDNIRFTFAAGLADVGSVSVSNNDDGTGTITLHGKTLTTSTAVAIP